MSIPDSKQALYELFTSDTDLGLPATELQGLIVRVFKGEPTPGQAPTEGTLTIFSSNSTAIDDYFRVSIYAGVKPDVLAAQDAADRAVEAARALLDADDRFGRSEWTHGYDQTIDAFVWSTLVEVGREDF